MAYNQINGFIEDIYESETRNGRPYLGIKFYSKEAANYPEIKFWFTENTVEFDSQKIQRLCHIAGVEEKPVTTIQAALKVLSNPVFAALMIPVSVSPNEWEGVTREQYDIGWPEGEQQEKVSAFDKFREEAMSKIAAIKELDAIAKGGIQVSTAPYDDKDIPF